MEVKKGYKKTEIGVFPEDWEIKELGKCLQSRPDYGIGAPAVNYKDSLPIYLRITDISEQGKFIKGNITSVDNPSSENYLLNINEIVVARTGASVGKSYLYNPSDGKLVFAGFLIRLKPINEEVNSRYLFELTQTNYYKSWINSNSMRSGQPGVNSNELASFQIPIPPLPEQKAIATALSDMDALIAQTEKLIEKKKAMKQGMMQELLKPKKGWVVYKLNDLVLRISTGLNPRTNFKLNSGGHNYYVTIKNFKDGKLFLDDKCDKIDDNALKIINNRSDLRIGDILLASIGRVGDLYLIKEQPQNWNINESVFTLRPNPSIIDPSFFCVLFGQQTIKSKLDSGATGSTFQSIKVGDLRKLEFVVPTDLREQIKISSILSDLELHIEIQETKLQKLKLQKQGMMQELLTGRIRLL